MNMNKAEMKALAEHYSELYPDWSNEQIAKEMGVSVRSVYRYIGSQKDRDKEHLAKAEKFKINEANCKILLFDLETAPMETYTWGLKTNGYISPENIIKDWSILTWGAKWLFSPRVMSASVRAEDAVKRDDSSIIRRLWSLFDEADVLIAHNLKAFDARKANARFLANGLPPPRPYMMIDTLKASRNKFALSSHRLDDINAMLGLTQKTDAPFSLWKDAVQGSQTALNKMKSYCANDVSILEELYMQLRPWIPSHPNLGTYVEGIKVTVCPRCASPRLDWRGKYHTPVGRYRAFRCQDCLAIGRSKVNELTTAERKLQAASVN